MGAAASAAAWSCRHCGGHEQDEQRRGKCKHCWTPLPGPQTRFLSLKCFEALLGGAAGGGKTDSLLVDAIRYVGAGHGRNYMALILRREFPDLNLSLVPRSHVLYPRLGGKYNKVDHVWTFPGGESVHFGHCQHEHDVHRYQGAAFQFIGFDELTTFTEYQYTYLISRLRSAHGVPLRLRGATNPGGAGHEWVFRRFGRWLDPSAPDRSAPGEVVYFLKERDDERVVPRDAAKEMIRAREAAPPTAREGMPLPLGRTFVPAKLSDNPYLAADGEYARALEELDPVRRKQLKEGDWLARPAKGEYFKRGWFKFLDAAPAQVTARCRYWDLAGSKSAKGDWAAGVKISRTPEGLFVIEHVARGRGTPGETRALVKTTAELDGKDLSVWIEQDPGQAGADQMLTYAQLLVGWTVRPRSKRVDKILAAGPLSAQAQAGNVALVRGAWNEAFITEAEAFPEGDHDDQVDGASGGFAVVTGNVAPGFSLPETIAPRRGAAPDTRSRSFLTPNHDDDE